MSDPVLLPVPGTFGLVGFDTADVVRGALHQGLDQTVSLFLKKGGGAGLPVVAMLGAENLQDFNMNQRTVHYPVTEVVKVK